MELLLMIDGRGYKFKVNEIAHDWKIAGMDICDYGREGIYTDKCARGPCQVVLDAP
jgi:hypothetical protein